MHPSELPVAVLADPARRTDAAVFRLLARGLGDDFHVFYRPRVTGMDAGQHKVPDFVLLHPRHGLLGVAIDEETLVGEETRPLPYAPIRSAVRSLIFALKEQGIRFYIPAPCCVLFMNSHRVQYQPPSQDLEYTPLFADELGDDLQDRLLAMMPISAGYQSTWRVPDAVEKITPFLQVNTPLAQDGKVQAAGASPATAILHDAAHQAKFAAPSVEQPQRIVYVVRAVDIVLAFATIMAFIMLVAFLPDGAIRRFVGFSHEWAALHQEENGGRP